MNERSGRRELVQRMENAGRELSTAMVLFHANLAASVGLGPTEEKLLELVMRLDRPTPGQLGVATGLAPASITGALDRMESKGFVERTRDETDARRVRVSVRQESIGGIARRFEGLMRRLGDLYAGLDEEQLAVVADVLEQMAVIQMEEAVRLADMT
jgi:DNA-binding MarR family transcriptional regulator